MRLKQQAESLIEKIKSETTRAARELTFAKQLTPSKKSSWAAPLSGRSRRTAQEERRDGSPDARITNQQTQRWQRWQATPSPHPPSPAASGHGSAHSPVSCPKEPTDHKGARRPHVSGKGLVIIGRKDSSTTTLKWPGADAGCERGAATGTIGSSTGGVLSRDESAAVEACEGVGDARPGGEARPGGARMPFRPRPAGCASPLTQRWQKLQQGPFLHFPRAKNLHGVAQECGCPCEPRARGTRLS